MTWDRFTQRRGIRETQFVNVHMRHCRIGRVRLADGSAYVWITGRWQSA